MKEWLAKTFGLRPEQVPTTQPELIKAKVQLKRELSRADRAIQLAMNHADELFNNQGHYKGPERRRRRRHT